MTVEISVSENYILVEPSPGLNYWDILEGASKISKMKEFKEKNDIWIFETGTILLSINDLYKLHDIIVKHYPNVKRIRKTAVVVDSGFMSGLAGTFIGLFDDLPFKLKVFKDLASAEKWVLD